jgi:hypothetical protein
LLSLCGGVRCAIQHGGAKESHDDGHTALHNAGYHHGICRRCGSAGQLASITSDISAYASSHRGQGIDGCSDKTFGWACPRVQVILEWLTRVVISGPPYHERIDEEFPFA